MRSFSYKNGIGVQTKRPFQNKLSEVFINPVDVSFFWGILKCHVGKPDV